MKSAGDSTIGNVFRAGLCTGCGLCEAVCPARAVRVAYSPRRGIMVPAVGPECTGCGLCSRVCPGGEVDFAGLNSEFIGEKHPGDILGSFRTCWYAHANDLDIRYRAASGGAVTALLLHAFDTGMIDGAVVTRMSEENPLQTRSFLARSRADILGARGSRYCPSTLGAALREAFESEGRFAVAGLPCQIHGVRKWQHLAARAREKFSVLFGIFCCNNNTGHGTIFFLKKQGIDPKDVAEMRYRGKGWPGVITVRLRSGSVLVFRRGTSEPSPKRRRVLSSAFHFDFLMRRCLLCADLMADLADISFADPWNPEMLKNEKLGRTMLVVRTPAGENVLESAAQHSLIEREFISADVVRNSQSTGFKCAVGARLRLRRLAGRPIPSYPGKVLRASAVDCMMQYRYVLSHFTSHRCVWPLIVPFARFREVSSNWLMSAAALAARLIRGKRRTAASQETRK